VFYYFFLSLQTLIKPLRLYESPFQDRCEFLHDPSAEGRIPSWLRDTQKHDSNIQTDVHINNLQQLNVQSIHKTDFGVLCPIKHPSQNLFKDWTNAVDIVCNKSTSFNPEMFGIKRKHMIQIILKLRPKCGNSHTYQDTHMVFDRLCMVLDARSYCISGDKMIEIDYHPHNPHHKGIITAHHIVFHPDQLLDSKCPTAIYFNIPAHEISACFHDPKKDKNLDFSKLSQVKQCHSKCYFFKLVSALDKEIDHLIVDILQDHQSKLFDNCVQKKDFDLKEMAMISRFNSLRLFFELWAYPVNASIDMSRGNISQSTKKPEVTSTYDIPVSSCNVGKASRIAWDSFCHQSQSCKKKSNRLPIFQKLEYRIWEDQNIARNNIHIKDFATSLKVSQKSERCWKSILLPNHNDWDLVKHQIRERNKKTLSQ